MDWEGYQQFRPAFRSALDQRYYPIEWLDGRLAARRARFMRSDNAAIVVELRLFPGGAMDVHGLIAAGDQSEIVGILIPQAEEWGREQGCVAGAVESRPGWARALKASGYEVHQVTIKKEL